MTLVFPEGYRYDCGSCTKCCRTTWNVHVDPRSFDKVEGSPLFERIKAEQGRDPVYMTEVQGERTALALVNKGGCVFLSADRLCSIHREMGLGAKPLGCREFPFLPVPTPDGVYVGLSFYCSAVQANNGRPVEAHAETIEGFLTEYRYSPVGFDPIVLDRDLAISWGAYKHLEDVTRGFLDDDDLGRGLWDFAMTVARTACLLRTEASAGVRWLVPDARWNQMLERASEKRVERDELFQQVEQMFLTGIVGVLESASPEACKRNTEAVFRRTVLQSDSFAKDIDLQQFDDFRGRFDASWSRGELRRYFQQLVFRKFLALKRPIVANAAAFYLSVALLEWYRDLSAYAAGKLEPDIQDLRRAFDVVERGFVMHARNMDPFFTGLAETHQKLLLTA